MVIGYARVSTKDQNLARQEEALKGVERVYFDKSTGKNQDRQEFQKMISALRPGDTLKVVSIDRLGRNVRELVNTSYELEKMGVNIISIKEGIDTSSPIGKIFFTLIAVFAEMELNSIHERQRAGIEVAKREGRFKGRPPKELNEDLGEIIKAVDSGKYSVKQACRLLGVGRSTFYRRKAQYEEMSAIPANEVKQPDNGEIDFP